MRALTLAALVACAAAPVPGPVIMSNVGGYDAAPPAPVDRYAYASFAWCIRSGGWLSCSWYACYCVGIGSTTPPWQWVP